ncbi:MAG: RDD family protein [Pseudomonadota bacterium]
MPQCGESANLDSLISSSVNSTSSNQPQLCSFTRRLSALIYDGLIIIAIWMIGSIFVVVAGDGAIAAGRLWFQLYLLALSWAYFASSWLIGGQTVGMRAWKIRLISTRPARLGPKIGWLDSLIRFGVGLISLAVFGLGFIWSIFRVDRAGWHDLASRSRLIVADPNRLRHQ